MMPLLAWSTPRFHRAMAVLVLLASTGCAPTPAPAEMDDGWVSLFNGRDLSGWQVKINGYPLGENYGNTFRVVNGMLSVRYDQYDQFRDRFGHLFFQTPFARYHLLIEYRFTGRWAPGTPEWAYRNSGVMVHAQHPATMGLHQDFPISVEIQFLGGLGDGQPRPTGNMCSPGTEVTINGSMARAHCVSSASPTFEGDQWVRVEALVLGDSVIHMVNGDTVMRYTNPVIGGGVVNGFDAAVKRDGTPLRAGYIALQSEGHPIDFRRVAIRDLTRRRR